MPSIAPLQALDAWPSPLPPDRCISALTAARSPDERVVDSGPGWVELRGGSRAAFRLVGVFISYGRKRVPWRAVVHVDPEGAGSVVTVTMSSDQGAYLLPPIPSAVGAWSTRFETLDGILRAATLGAARIQPNPPLTLTGGGATRYAATRSRSRSQRVGRVARNWGIVFLAVTAVNLLLDSGRHSGVAVITHAAVTGVIAACVITFFIGVIRRP